MALEQKQDRPGFWRDLFWSLGNALLPGLSFAVRGRWKEAGFFAAGFYVAFLGVQKLLVISNISDYFPWYVATWLLGAAAGFLLKRWGGQAKTSAWGIAAGLAIVLLTTALMWGLSNTVGVQSFEASSTNMQPIVSPEQKFLVDHSAYWFEKPRSHDIVSFRLAGDEPILLSRVVGIEGQTLSVESGRVFIDGRLNDVGSAFFDPALLPEEEADSLVTKALLSKDPERMPPGYVFLMGDNRFNSRDSRFFGPVPLSAVTGRAALR